ncbi:MAG: ATP-dependent zinc protease family protein [Oceanococcus sp.]
MTLLGQIKSTCVRAAYFGCFLLAINVFLPNVAQANETHADNRVLAGWVERIALRASGDELKAKLDTGAKTSSINATNIKRLKRDGKKWVQFTLEYQTAKGGPGKVQLEKPLRRNVQVKEHEGDNDRRAVVDLEFCFAGQWHVAQFSLVDRRKFVYPVLLGRRFLQTSTLIDPSATFLTETNCVTSKAKNHD